jgi:hypothetical protein
MITEFLGPNLGINVFESLFAAFQQGMTIGTAMVGDAAAGVSAFLVNIGVVEGSTFNNAGPDVIPLFF